MIKCGIIAFANTQSECDGKRESERINEKTIIKKKTN